MEGPCPDKLQFKQSKARNFLINREVSGFLFAVISSDFHAIRQFYAKRCYDLCSAKRVLFRFGGEIEGMVDGCGLTKGCIREQIYRTNNSPALVKESRAGLC